MKMPEKGTKKTVVKIKRAVAGERRKRKGNIRGSAAAASTLAAPWAARERSASRPGGSPRANTAQLASSLRSAAAAPASVRQSHLMRHTRHDLLVGRLGAQLFHDRRRSQRLQIHAQRFQAGLLQPAQVLLRSLAVRQRQQDQGGASATFVDHPDLVPRPRLLLHQGEERGG